MGVGVGACATPNHASSNPTAALPPDPGWNIRRTTAERASSGARTGPTRIAIQSLPVTAAPLTVRSCRPLPSPDAYQAMRANAAPSPATTRACADASYHPPPSTVTAWYSHFVELDVETSSAPRSPLDAGPFVLRTPPCFSHPTNASPATASNPPFASAGPIGTTVACRGGPLIGIRLGGPASGVPAGLGCGPTGVATTGVGVGVGGGSAVFLTWKPANRSAGHVAANTRSIAW